VRQTYAGPVEFGEDLMAIDIGNTIAVRRFTLPPKWAAIAPGLRTLEGREPSKACALNLIRLIQRC